MNWLLLKKAVKISLLLHNSYRLFNINNSRVVNIKRLIFVLCKSSFNTLTMSCIGFPVTFSTCSLLKCYVEEHFLSDFFP